MDLPPFIRFIDIPIDEFRIVPDSVFSGFTIDRNTPDPFEILVQRLCNYLDIPDLNTRSGLKKVHARFDDINHCLNAHFTTALAIDDPRPPLTICFIWSKMCADKLLRDRLFRSGLFLKLVKLLGDENTGNLVVIFLDWFKPEEAKNATGIPLDFEIARYNSQIVSVLQKHRRNSKIAGYALRVLAHTTPMVLASEELWAARPNLGSDIAVTEVVSAVLDVFKQPAHLADDILQIALIPLLRSCVSTCREQCRNLPDVLPFFTSLTHSTNLTARSIGAAMLLRIARLESEAEGDDPELMVRSRLPRADNLEVALTELPPDLLGIMRDHGIENCETLVKVRCATGIMSAMRTFEKDRDLRALGVRLAGLAQESELVCDPEAFIKSEDVPFEQWIDAMHYCATVFREQGGEANLDLADVLELKHLLTLRRKEALALAERAVARNPDVAFAHYAITLQTNKLLYGLQAAKKGLKCKNLTPYLRRRMLWCAVEHAGEEGMRLLCTRELEPKEDRKAQALAYLESAAEDARTFIETSAPDARQMTYVIDWYIVVTIVLRGPELDDDFEEFAPLFDKLHDSYRFMDFLGFRILKTNIYLTRQRILEHWTSGAYKDWAAFLDRITRLKGGNKDSPGPSAEEREHWRKLDSILNENTQLYRCSWCTNPSAILRKCSGCGKTRYCDAQCQKLHWREHKRPCKDASSLRGENPT
ncbi:hypothetical protein LXA43DRAFT_1042935 [Ganoderma leucocontextum]|nr:hypothetical protein LXA43DRAFT_1042935 [Ganoderma leucocontextum]